MLLEAVTRGRLYQVRFLLETDSAVVDSTDHAGQTPLMKAILLGDKMRHTRYKIVRLLLEHGAKVNVAEKNGKTALMLAVILGHQDITERILRTSIIDLDINAGDHDGNTALIHAAIRGRTNIARILINSIKRFGLDVDKKNINGMTAMLEATRHGHSRTAEVLMVEGDACLTIRDPFYYMDAYEWAVQNELHDLVQTITSKHQPLALKSKDSSCKSPDETVWKEKFKVEKQEVSLTSEPQLNIIKRQSSKKKGNKAITVPRVLQKLNDTNLAESMAELEVSQEISRQDLIQETEAESAMTSHDNETVGDSESENDVGHKSAASGKPVTTMQRSSTPRLRSASSGTRLNAKSDFQSLLQLYGIQSSVTYRKGYDISTLSPSGVWPDPTVQNSLSNSYESIFNKEDSLNDFIPLRTSSRRSMVLDGQGTSRRMGLVGATREEQRISIGSGISDTDRRRKITAGSFSDKGMFERLARKPGDRKMSMIVRPNMERPTLRRMQSTISPLAE